MQSTPFHAQAYVGRFAPTPSGPLHFGSLVAALGSFLQARSRSGRWLLRVDDLDAPRVLPGSIEGILATLAAFGLHWDGEVIYQSQRYEAYREGLRKLQDTGLCFECGCSRKALVQTATRQGTEGLIYPGTCRQQAPDPKRPHSMRMWVQGVTVPWHDQHFGPQLQNLEQDIGDFVVWRGDGVCSYHLSVALDEPDFGVTEVVRGSDLMASTPRQIWLMRLLGKRVPDYLHLPVAVNAQGEKWSKQTKAPALNAAMASVQLHKALEFLGQAPPTELKHAPCEELLGWACQHWNLDQVPKFSKIEAYGGVQAE